MVLGESGDQEGAGGDQQANSQHQTAGHPAAALAGRLDGALVGDGVQRLCPAVTLLT